MSLSERVISTVGGGAADLAGQEVYRPLAGVQDRVTLSGRAVLWSRKGPRCSGLCVFLPHLNYRVTFDVLRIPVVVDPFEQLVSTGSSVLNARLEGPAALPKGKILPACRLSMSPTGLSLPDVTTPVRPCQPRSVPLPDQHWAPYPRVCLAWTLFTGICIPNNRNLCQFACKWVCPKAGIKLKLSPTH